MSMRVSGKNLATTLTGKAGNQTMAEAIRATREWYEEIPPGDALCLRCESADPAKQFRVWKRWFARHEDKRWRPEEEFKSFFRYKPVDLSETSDKNGVSNTGSGDPCPSERYYGFDTYP